MFCFPRTIRSLSHASVLALITCGTAMAGSITYNSPTSGSTVSSPIHVNAQASSSTSIRYTNLYLDGNKVASVSGATIDKYLTTGSGSHRIAVQAMDNSGALFSKAIYVTVSDSTSDTTSTKTYSNIEEMSAWSSCSSCAGAGGTGPVASFYQALNISSPSLDGNSSKFHLGGSTAYSNALWWKQLGANSSASHFTYDLYFYLKNPSASQALEFDVNQSVSGKKYIFGTECGFASKVWKVYSVSLKWVSTSIPCTVPSSYTWHHLIWEFQRTSGGNVSFIAFTLDGVKHYVNKSYAPKSSSVNEINVAFQMDGNKYMTDYDTWLDNVKLTYW